jgi:hypothetical protein
MVLVNMNDFKKMHAYYPGLYSETFNDQGKCQFSLNFYNLPFL